MYTKRIVIGMLAALLVVSVLPMGAVAHVGNNHGTIKIHDDEVVEPPQRNQPKVSCDFWIEGFKMSDESGFVEIRDKETGDLVFDDSWEADREDEPRGFHFLLGPIRLEPGHYKAEAFVDKNDEDEHKSKSKVFKVEECEERTPCPDNLEATANGDGSVSLTWDAVAGADSYNVYRSADDSDPTLLDSTTDTEYLDETTVPGVTYRYIVTAVIGEVESEDCDEVEITAIPFFPGVIGMIAALAGTVAAVLVARRK